MRLVPLLWNRTLKQGELDVSEYFDRITKLWVELDAICGFDEEICGKDSTRNIGASDWMIPGKRVR